MIVGSDVGIAVGIDTSAVDGVIVGVAVNCIRYLWFLKLIFCYRPLLL